MRAMRTTLAAACLAGLAPAWAPAADATVEQILRFQPLIKGVEYDIPADAAAIAACKVETVAGPKGPIGYALRDGQGKMLRRFVNLRGTPATDQWGYYQDGFEVYREVDLNDDKNPDEARWMNAAGTRVAKLNNGKVAGWSRISAEEASKVFVQALAPAEPDLALVESVMATPEDLESLGVPKSEVDAVAAAAKNRAAAVRTLRAGLAGWDADTTWLGLNAALPHVIPADAGLKDDLYLHENVTIFAGPSGGGGAGKTALLQVGEIVKVGDCWKLVDLPRTVDPKTGMIAAFDGGVRTAVFRNEGGGAAPGVDNPQVAEALAALAAYDKQNSALLTGEDPKGVARFHIGRTSPLNKVIQAAEAAGDAKSELDHRKLFVDSLAAAYTTGAYPDAPKYLEQMTAKGGKVGSYAAFKQIEAEFALQNDNQGGNFSAIQDAWLGKLKGFVEKYPQSDEAPQSLLLLASTNEMSGREDEGRKYYAQLAEVASGTEYGKKAAGALRRLDLVGKPLALRGVDLQGRSVDTAALRGKTVLVTFWATWAQPAKRDLPELARLYAKYSAKGFAVVGVSLDNDKADLDAFLKSSPLPWPEVFEPGGLESRLATEFGIISLPTMFLVEPDGKVSNRNLQTAAQVEVLLDKSLGKAEKVALSPK